MKKFLIIISILTSHLFFATNYYVSPSGNDDADGQLETPFQTIQRASYAVVPGDTVFIRNGIYETFNPESIILYMTITGTEGNPITYRNYPGETPILKLNSNNWAAITTNGCNYIIIDGLTIVGNNDNVTLAYALSQQLNTNNPTTSGNGIAINAEYTNETNKSQHTIVRNCKVSKCGGGGIYTYGADYTTIENNTVFECGWYTPYGNSGISMYQNNNSDASTGIKNFIIGNTCYRNENFIPFFVVGSITDGNGIIIDDNRNTQNNSNGGIYTGKTYVANNLVFDNGGRGIHCFESDNVIVANNTCYQNCKSETTRQGELTAINASNITFVNNIVSPAFDVPPIGQFEATNITAFNNLFTANAAFANPSGTNTITGLAAFVQPSTDASIADFHLTEDSFAISTGTPNNAPLTDKDGNVRLTNNLIDIGCYEFQNTLKSTVFNSEVVALYPNPSEKILSINLKNKDLKNSEIAFYNSIGEKVKTISEIPNQEIFTTDISDFQAGIYFVSLLKKNTTTFLGKFIKE
jgi:parallel beta-helix repeat protein